MLSRKYFLIAAVTLALVVAGFFAVRTYASTGCFLDTNGLPTETFICWMKDNNITSGCGGGNYCPGAYVTRSQMAVFMNKQAEIPPSTGYILIAGDTTSWNYTNAAAPINKDISGVGYTAFQRTAIGYNYLRISPTIPLSLYGRYLKFIGFEMCYIASTDATLADVYIDSSAQVSSPVGSNVALASDTTDRTDTACRFYSLPTPETMTFDDAGIFIRPGVNWNTINAWFYVGRVTLYFQPTTDVMNVAGAELTGNDVIILETAGEPQPPETGGAQP